MIGNLLKRFNKDPRPTPQERIDAAVDEALRSAPVIPEPQIKQGLAEPEAFYAALRGGDLRHKSTGQVAGTNAILAAMVGLPISWVAYALATAWHETNQTMQPVKEANWLSAAAAKRYFMRMYDRTGQRPHVAKDLGNTVIGDGALFAGRGYVQLTGRRNYAKASVKLGVDLIGNPDLAMQPDIAAKIMREGMIGAWFTERGFVTFLPEDGPATLTQFTQARRIINGMDKAGKIALEAMDFQAALIAGGWE
jgi:predicted chitinase